MVDGEYEEYLQCQDCGERSPDVKHTTCPFAAEIHGEDTEIVVCDECHHQRFMDT